MGTQRIMDTFMATLADQAEERFTTAGLLLNPHCKTCTCQKVQVRQLVTNLSVVELRFYRDVLVLWAVGDPNDPQLPDDNQWKQLIRQYQQQRYMVGVADRRAQMELEG